ncbi:unnamed protein product, partial [Urochloa humidicola]
HPAAASQVSPSLAPFSACAATRRKETGRGREEKKRKWGGEEGAVEGEKELREDGSQPRRTEAAPRRRRLRRRVEAVVRTPPLGTTTPS